MAAINYSGIRDAIKSLLEGDSTTNVARIYVEEEPQFGLQDVAVAVLVYLDRRSAPPANQRLSAGREIHYHLQISLSVVSFALESFAKAVEQRDDLLSKVELVLLSDPTLGGTVNSSWLEGGELYSVRNPQAGNFVAVAETTLTADVTAII